MEDTAENSDNLGVSNTETEVNNDNVDCEGTQDNALMAPVSEEVIGGENDTVVTSSAVSETPTSAPKELYGFDTEPMRCSGAWTEFYSPQHNTTKNNFLKGCKWQVHFRSFQSRGMIIILRNLIRRSPDGLCVLTASDDNCSRIFELPQVFYESESADGSQPAEMVCIRDKQCL